MRLDYALNKQGLHFRSDIQEICYGPFPLQGSLSHTSWIFACHSFSAARPLYLDNADDRKRCESQAPQDYGISIILQSHGRGSHFNIITQKKSVSRVIRACETPGGAGHVQPSRQVHLYLFFRYPPAAAAAAAPIRQRWMVLCVRWSQHWKNTFKEVQQQQQCVFPFKDQESTATRSLLWVCTVAKKLEPFSTKEIVPVETVDSVFCVFSRATGSFVWKDKFLLNFRPVIFFSAVSTTDKIPLTSIALVWRQKSGKPGQIIPKLWGDRLSQKFFGKRQPFIPYFNSLKVLPPG